jgi:hypothetical protein
MDMKAQKTLVTLALLLATGTPAWSADAVSANVNQVGTYGSGRSFIDISANINEAGCANDRFDLDPAHPQAKNVLAIALVALATGRKIKVKTNGCYGTYPTLDNSTESYVLVAK